MNPVLRVEAFEIVPDVAELLGQNCRRNGVIDRVSIYNRGVGDPALTLTIPSTEGRSALPDFYSTRFRFDEGLDVRVISLDSVSPRIRTGERVLAKIDVEGTEDEIFRHGQEFLRAHRPTILCEVLRDQARAHAVQAPLLKPHGYHFYLVRDGGLLAAEEIRPDERFRDWLFSTGGASAVRAVVPGLASHGPRV